VGGSTEVCLAEAAGQEHGWPGDWLGHEVIDVISRLLQVHREEVLAFPEDRAELNSAAFRVLKSAPTPMRSRSTAPPTP
jgi:hypothetical protein